MTIKPGQADPIGAHVEPGGVNFCVYSRDATLVELMLFDHPHAERPSVVFPLDPLQHRTYHYWHAFVPGIGPGQVYAYRAHGPHDEAVGMRFDAEKTLLDPYGRAVAMPRRYDRGAASRPGDNTASAFKSVVIDPHAYDWEGDRPLHLPFGRSVIYEMHVRGFTANPNSGVSDARRGTYAGLIEKIPYLVDLGITAVELLPVMQFDPQDAPLGLTNYWGYSPVSFFAPHVLYASTQNPIGVVNEFRDMVKALHRAGIEVILDVVYNHTAEGDERGPMLCYRGLDNRAYYILEKDKRRYSNFTGCGNTLNANHSSVRRLILDSLRYWVRHMHIDGFRFDLASILTRDHKGVPLKNPPILWDIESDPALAGAKLIAEAWDAAGLYQVGNFVGDNWKEWNGRYRDDVRKFLRGDRGSIRDIPPRLLGSPDLYEQDLRPVEQSVNFVTCHDGFTLNDLFSYSQKHNQANGEDNRDGNNDNFSMNCGHEGPSDDPQIERLRSKQCKNAMAVLMLSMGVPMLWMGDEVRRTQKGNNNAYCQDNPTSWFDWTCLHQHGEMLQFVKGLIRLRRRRPTDELDRLPLAERLRRSKVRWHGTRLRKAEWDDDTRCLSATITSADGEVAMHLILNGSDHGLDFELPRPPKAQGAWIRVVDSAFPAGKEIAATEAEHDANRVEVGTYHAHGRSVVLLVARMKPLKSA